MWKYDSLSWFFFRDCKAGFGSFPPQCRLRAWLYVTPLYEQAAKWCGKFKRRGKDGIISRYEYDESRESELKTLKFDSYSGEWLDFILNCRSGKDSTDYDLVVGGVANDKVFNTVELFVDGLIDKTEAINRLRYEKPNLQICFRTEKALSLLHFEGSETL